MMAKEARGTSHFHVGARWKQTPRIARVQAGRCAAGYDFALRKETASAQGGVVGFHAEMVDNGRNAVLVRPEVGEDVVGVVLLPFLQAPRRAAAHELTVHEELIAAVRGDVQAGPVCLAIHLEGAPAVEVEVLRDCLAFTPDPLGTVEFLAHGARHLAGHGPMGIHKASLESDQQ
jgi:hypothetical protein